ncbi:MAG: glycosyltransferase [Alphaproteobacteria bacterium]
MDLAQGEYLAIMDHDDISLTDRFKMQAAYLDAHPDVGVLGTAHREIPKDKLGYSAVEDNEGIEEAMMLGCALLHPTTMMRKSVLEKSGLRYDKEYFPTEDYNLYFLHLLGKTRFGCLPEVLFLYEETRE